MKLLITINGRMTISLTQSPNLDVKPSIPHSNRLLLSEVNGKARKKICLYTKSSFLLKNYKVPKFQLKDGL